MIKKILFISLSIIMLLSLSSCGMKNENQITDENGEPLKLDITQVSESNFYIYDKKDETFTPVMGGATGTMDAGAFESALEHAAGTDNVSYCWCGSKDVDLFKLIPSVDNKRTRLVMLIANNDDMPEEYHITKYKLRGYTLGVNFTFGETGNKLFLDTSNLCETSMASDVLKDVAGGQLRIYKINNSKKLPKDNVDINLNVLLGLEKNKKYQVGFFNGTVYKDVDLVADTAIFQGEGVTRLSDPITVTDKQYFYVKIPTNLKNGYYYINDAGMFKYTGAKK